MRKMAATSLQNVVLLDSEECHECATSCAYAYDVPMVGSYEDGGGGKMAIQIPLLNGMPLLGEMEELSERCGKACWKRKDSKTRQEKKVEERPLWLRTWRKPSSGSVFQWFGRGERILVSLGRYCGCYVGTSSTSGVFSLKDAWRSRSRPSRPFSQGQSGLPDVLQDAMSEVTKFYPPLKLWFFVTSQHSWVGDARSWWRRQKRSKKKLKREVEEKGLKLSITEGGKEDRAT